MDPLAIALATATAAVAISVPRLLLQRVVVGEHEHVLHLRDGRVVRVLPPGAHRLRRRGLALVRFDRRRALLELSGQDVLTADSVPVKLSATVAYAVADPLAAYGRAAHWYADLHATAQQALRLAVAERPFDELMAKRFDLGARMTEAMAADAGAVGVAVASARIKDVMLGADLKKAMTDIVRARQDGLAALERARGETAALRSLANAARLLKDQPELAQLKALTAIADAAQRGGSTFVIGADALATKAARPA